MGVVVGFSNLSAKFKRFLDSLPGDLARLKTKAVNLAGKAFFKVSGGGVTLDIPLRLRLQLEYLIIRNSNYGC